MNFPTSGYGQTVSYLNLPPYLGMRERFGAGVLPDPVTNSPMIGARNPFGALGYYAAGRRRYLNHLGDRRIIAAPLAGTVVADVFSRSSRDRFGVARDALCSGGDERPIELKDIACGGNEGRSRMRLRQVLQILLRSRVIEQLITGSLAKALVLSTGIVISEAGPCPAACQIRTVGALRPP